MNLYDWIDKRQSKILPHNLYTDQVMKRIYTKLEPCKYWNDLYPAHLNSSEYGAVFNLEFSPLGNILAAACERRAIVLFDAISQKQTHRVMKAHTDNVNCIKFLNNQTFATCSDDTTVAIWDTRFLKNRVRMLQGHSNWVKNIEYSNKDKLLVTSGFDGSIFTWDINAHTEEGLVYQKVFNTSGLMRCRISPDGTKLVMCTTGGYLMIIHHLDLTTLRKDLRGFRPTLYRLMQMANQFIPNAAKFDHIFSKNQKRNRVELVTDFPEDNEAEIIHALQIHPQGLSILSRNVSIDERNEYSCIHDINEEVYDITKRRKRKQTDYDGEPPSEVSRFKRRIRRTIVPEESDSDQPSTSNGVRSSVRENQQQQPTTDSGRRSKIRKRAARPANPSTPHGTTYNLLTTTSASSAVGLVHAESNTNSNDAPAAPAPTAARTPPSTNFVPDIWAAEISVAEREARQARQSATNTVSGYDFVYAISSGIMQNANTSTDTSTATRPLPPVASSSTTLYLNDNPIPYSKEFILQNPSKLMYYIQESNEGRGFIKESCFSSDGRIICSPYKNGVRLLSFSENCSEHPSQYMNAELKRSPRPLFEVKTIDCHKDIVLSTSFSPKQPLLVTGCKQGKVTWHYPYL
ncbi:DDB1- and CUL4-associated factor 10 homolog [Episyrphus balteatus]|uniref:DDB1- and CUL4-associated factor 10 homolog n=1 Tax=Episyrphus balteatus TaxID=286459 RepID=UPI002485242B|nr:DDB1- and CUL4-associated factor 10 homolog [Episyrphus balteatus]